MSPEPRTKGPQPFGRRQAASLLFSLVLSGLLTGLLVADGVARGLNVGYWTAMAVVVVAVVVGLPVVVVAIVILFVLGRNRRLRSEEYEFGRVRKLAQTEGAEVRVDLATAWVAEPDDHPPLLHEALETARTRFEALLPGARAEVDMPLRVVCFEDKRHLEAYGRMVGLPFEALDGVFLQGRPRRILVAVEVVPRRPTDPTRTLRALFAHFFLERFKGFLLPTWLSVGTTHVLANAGDRGERERLNRKVLALLAREGPPDEAALFQAGGRQFVAALRTWRTFEGYAHLARVLICARSLGEHLAGAHATADRLTRFRAFLLELDRTDAPEIVFEKHFGYRFGMLLNDWRQAVEALGPGEHEPPTTRIREALLNRAIPLLGDPGSSPWERIRMIRDMGSAGYPLGADALIRTLAHGEKDVAREAALALEGISGMAAGTDVGRWWEWWQGLPSAAVPLRDTAIREGRKPELG